ncbi:MAG: DUF2163 domain-containing protein [Hyphomonadaceae bacterium]|nr:DUF2163 domain-containing protein [Hyphomonadaceae bacterium]
MRALPEALRLQLETGVATLATAWRIERPDGVVAGFTDHDSLLRFDGVVFHPATARASEIVAKTSTGEADSARLLGVIDADGVDAEDLLAGAWDGARVDVWRVDWRDTALRVHVFAGRMGEVRRAGAGVEVAVRGLQAPFEKPFGRVYTRFCDADVGDTRCGVSLADGAYRGAGVVAALTGARTLTASGLGAFADGWFTRGVLTWADGGRAEVIAHRAAGPAVALELATPARAAGSAFTITAGCDKRLETCRAKFANVPNFRGFPAMPGNDAVSAGVDRQAPLDGGSRRPA